MSFNHMTNEIDDVTCGSGYIFRHIFTLFNGLSFLFYESPKQFVTPYKIREVVFFSDYFLLRF